MTPGAAGGGRAAAPLDGRVLVVGFGLTGRAVARAIARAGGTPVVVADEPPAGEAAAAAADLGLVVGLTPAGQALDDLVAGCDLVVPSPGVPVGHAVLAAATAAGVPVRSEIELASWNAAGTAPRLVAVTGTNGKTTVATWVTAVLEASGIRAIAAGNIGLPLVEAVSLPVDVVVAEVSSFQLQFTESFRPAVSCWLNLAADHLDWHPTMTHYAAAKARIWACQGAGDVAVVNAEDPAVTAAAASIPGGVRKMTFALEAPADYRLDGDRLVGPGGTVLLARSELPRALPHDVANALAAAAVADAAGASVQACRAALAAAPQLPHRVSLVAEAGGVRWYDDSKATTPASVQAAVAGFPSVVLIAGGYNKGLDLGSLAATVPPVRAVVAIGGAAADVAAAFAGRVPVTTATSMEGAVAAAAAAAGPGDAVLLSPGCASFDWYPSYAARGDHFAALVARHLGRPDLQRGEHHADS